MAAPVFTDVDIKTLWQGVSLALRERLPEGEFEETLLESAVSYDTWENRLKIRLIIEKVIDHELKAKATISSEDISEFYEKPQLIN